MRDLYRTRIIHILTSHILLGLHPRIFNCSGYSTKSSMSLKFKNENNRGWTVYSHVRQKSHWRSELPLIILSFFGHVNASLPITWKFFSGHSEEISPYNNRLPFLQLTKTATSILVRTVVQHIILIDISNMTHFYSALIRCKSRKILTLYRINMDFVHQ